MLPNSTAPIKTRRSLYLVQILLLVAISALTYLPNISRATHYRDDWYYMVDRLKGGPGVFEQMFSIDRPARAPLFEALYQLFGIQPLPYQWVSYLWRLLSGLSALWLFHLLWPGRRKEAFFMALLVILYPGYVRWMEGLENQPRMLSFFLQVLSIVLTLQALKSKRLLPKIAWTAGAVLTGWGYIALVDFAFGMEIFRLLCVFIFASRQSRFQNSLQKALTTLRMWAPSALIPLGFLFWRFFIFHNTRTETDVSLQVGYLFASPLLKGLWWLIRLFQSVLNTAFLAWAVPLYRYFFGNRLRDLLVGFGIAFLVLALIGLFAWLAKKSSSQEADPDLPAPGETPWQTEAFWIGLIGVLAGVGPVIVANRHVVFESYSHYALPASLAAAVLAAGLVFSLKTDLLRWVVLSTLAASAVLTHYGISLQTVYEAETINAFWWQVVWRAPGIQAGATLFVQYPTFEYTSDGDVVTGPANLIYYPEVTNQVPVTYPLGILAFIKEEAQSILAGEPDRAGGYRTHTWTKHYDNVLVMSQPAEGACVHVFDGAWPRFSVDDVDRIRLVGEFSKIQNVLTDVQPPTLPAFIFGSEPAHTWCYYYEKAELAFQKGEWETIVSLGDEAIQKGEYPIDRVEWFPFLQAYASLGDEQRLRDATPRINEFPYLKPQACTTLQKMIELGMVKSPSMQALIGELFCPQ
jgi:hypothetical protein